MARRVEDGGASPLPPLPATDCADRGGRRAFVVPEAEPLVATTAGLYASGRRAVVPLEI